MELSLQLSLFSDCYIQEFALNLVMTTIFEEEINAEVSKSWFLLQNNQSNAQKLLIAILLPF